MIMSNSTDTAIAVAFYPANAHAIFLISKGALSTVMKQSFRFMYTWQSQPGKNVTYLLQEERLVIHRPAI